MISLANGQMPLKWDEIADGATYLPWEVLNMSFLRSVIRRKPSASISPISPVWNQPSGSIASAVASGMS